MSKEIKTLSINDETGKTHTYDSFPDLMLRGMISDGKIPKSSQLSLGIHTDGKLYVFVNGKPYGLGIKLSGGESEDIVIPEKEQLYFAVNWLDTAYVVGSTEYNYNAWIPGNAAYDDTRGKIMLWQTQTSKHMDNNAPHHTLCAINPYNVLEYEKINITDEMGTENTVGGLIVENGIWTIYTMTTVYRSGDGGDTWTTKAVVTPPDRMYGVTKIDSNLYAGDDSGNNGTGATCGYWFSSDDGLNWEWKLFGLGVTDYDADNALKFSEATFCKFQGKIYANLRVQNTNGLLLRLDDTIWTVVSTSMPNVSSDTTMVGTDDAICMAGIDRHTLKLHLATYTEENGVEIIKTYDMADSSCGGGGAYCNDFHTPSYVVGDDFQAVFFMNGLNRYDMEKAYNCCVIGYANGISYNAPSYDIDTTVYDGDDYTIGEPMTAVINTETGSVTTEGWAALTGNKLDGTKFLPPNENGNPQTVSFGLGRKEYAAINNVTHDSSYALFTHNGVEYVGLLAAVNWANPATKHVGMPVFTEYEADGAMAGSEYCGFLPTGEGYLNNKNYHTFYRLTARDAKII